MTFSPLTAYTVDHHGKYNPRYGQSVVRIIVHHWAGTTGGDSRLMNPDQEVSANYILYGDGTLVGQVPEEYRAWTSGSWEADSPSITVEIQNSGVGGDWPVSDAAINKLTELIADLGRRYGWGSISWGAQVRGHREFYATACPGPYLWDRLSQIAANANAMLGGAAPAPSGGVSGDVDALARAVIRGDYGNGPTRRANLGARYDEVQARVNQILSGGGSAPAPAPAPASSNPAVVQPGDGYWHVAKRVWGGDNATIEANMNKLIDINGGVRLYAGMVLQTEYPAPVVDNSAAEAAAKAQAEAEAAAKAKAEADTAAAKAAEEAKTAEEAAKQAEADAKAKAEADAKAEAERLAQIEATKAEEAKIAEEAKKTVIETVIETISEGINNIMDEKYNGKGLTPEQYAQLQADIKAEDVAGIEEVKNYNLFSKEFWNYSAERVIKTFAMATAGQLSVTAAYVVTTPDSAVVFADLGWTYIISVASISALTSLLTALSNFKDIITIKKDNNL